MQLEGFYQQLRPFQLATGLYLLGLCVFLLQYLFYRRTCRFIGLLLLLAGFMSQVLGFVLRCSIASRPPVTNMYESILWVSAGVVFFGYLLWLFAKLDTLLTVGVGLGVFALIAADAAPAVRGPAAVPAR